MTLVVHGIGRLVTNTGSGDLETAWVVIDGGRVAAVGTGPVPAADEALDVAGRTVLPGFVDSHTHLVFGGDRADEFAARMAGAPYAAGGIVTTIEATRALDDDAWRRRRRRGSPSCTAPASPRSRSSPATAPPSPTRLGP